MCDPHAELRNQVLGQVLYRPVQNEPALRNAAAASSGVPVELRALIDKIHAHAYRVTERDITRLKGSYDEDELFEIVVSAALGASRKRLLAGLDAVEGA